MVFQSFNLFNNMTVLENCMVGQTKVLKKHEKEAKDLAMQYPEQGGHGSTSTPGPGSSPAARSSGGHRPGPGHEPGGPPL